MLFTTQVYFAQTSNPEIQTYNFVVNKDGSGDFSTIQEAINSVNCYANKKVFIFIKVGIYKEKLVIPKSKHNLSLIGEDKEHTVITFDDHSGKMDSTSNKTINTFTSYTLLVQGNDITIKDLTIENSTCNEGQAVALHVEGDHFIALNSNILGCQDTLFTGGENSNQYYENCYIEGTTDFIFGPATAVFKNCIIKSKKNSFVTAASTPEKQEFGYVFFNCELITDSKATKVYLGRPWRPFAKTVFINCKLGNHIVPEGWDPWLDKRFPNKDKTAYYAEYKSSGAGANSLKRVPWSYQLTKKEVKKYALKNIFKNWNIKNQLN